LTEAIAHFDWYESLFLCASKHLRWELIVKLANSPAPFLEVFIHRSFNPKHQILPSVSLAPSPSSNYAGNNRENIDIAEEIA
jgi:hypothetical protein